jgi:uncharacterized protein (DUF433 family)
MSEELIHSDSRIMSGTRITVELILEKLAAGETVEAIVKSHSRLTRKSIHAALAYAARFLGSEITFPKP